MGTTIIKLVKGNEPKELTEREKLYNNVCDSHHNLEKADNDLREKVVKGLRELLENQEKKEYNLLDNDIFVSFYCDGNDYNTIMAQSIYIRPNTDDIYVDTDNDSANHVDDIETKLLYCIYNDMYVRMLLKDSLT